jgi:hypothetical protein
MRRSAMSDITLDACPFCGGEAHRNYCISEDEDVARYCSKCYACGPLVQEPEDFDPGSDVCPEADAAWNRRASAPTKEERHE